MNPVDTMALEYGYGYSIATTRGEESAESMMHP
jgi:hypothetical protein